MGCDQSTFKVQAPVKYQSQLLPAFGKKLDLGPRYSEKVQQSFESCTGSGDFSSFIGLLDDTTEDLTAQACPTWAGRPRTIACSALACLNRQLRSGPVCFQGICPNTFLKQLRNLLAQEDSVLFQHLVYFLYRLVKRNYFVKELVDGGCLATLAQHLIYPNVFVRGYVARTVCRMYTNDPMAKRIFVEADGIQLLTAGLEQSQEVARVFADILGCVHALIKNSEEELELEFALPVLAQFSKIKLHPGCLRFVSGNSRRVLNLVMEALLKAKSRQNESNLI